MIPTDQGKYSKISGSSHNNQNITMIPNLVNQTIVSANTLNSPELIERFYKIPISTHTITIKDLHPAHSNTFVYVQLNSESNIKKLVHCTSQFKVLKEHIIKESEYILWMLSDSYVNILQYTDRKPLGSIIQINLSTYETINLNLNRQILPMLKVFTFSQSETFCICQYDQHTEANDPLKPKQADLLGKYHTKYKLSYYKFPLRKSHQKPQTVFKTHTNPKQYGFHQQIIKLNEHSMVGSISNKMDENDMTLLKTFDFRNLPMGIQINYKFHVQINYKKEILQLWVTDMWEIRPENFYLKCQLRADRNKQQLLLKQGFKISEVQSLEECYHLTWSYKTQNTIKFAKFKTPLLNNIQFTNGFNKKERSRVLYQRVLAKQKPIKVQNGFSNNTNTITQITPLHLYNQNTLKVEQNFSSIPNVTGFIQPKTEPVYVPSYVKSINYLPIFFINNQNQEILTIDQRFSDWLVTYPGYYPTMVIYFRQVSVGKEQRYLQIVQEKIKDSFNWKQLTAFLVTKTVNDVDEDLLKSTLSNLSLFSLNSQSSKVKQFDFGWSTIQNKMFRQTKSRSNYERQHK